MIENISKLLKLININKRKKVIVLGIFIMFISSFLYINLNNQSKVNYLITSVANKSASGKENKPANEYFDDEIFYKVVVDAYNKENKTSLPYEANLTDEQLGTITYLEHSDYNKTESEKISSVKGLEKLTSLQILQLRYNKISTIDISKNIKLTDLYLGCNNLSSIDVSKNTKLKSLDLEYNNLSSIDVGKNTVLTDLWLNHNNLSSIDISKNIKLTDLGLGDNNFSSVDVSNNKSLVKLRLYGNNLNSIDISNNTLLTYLDLSDNNLSSIDVSNNKSLAKLFLYENNLNSIDISNNTLLTYLYLFDNNLSSIDVSKNTALTYLNLYNNNLSSIDVSKNTALTFLYLNNNNLSSIDVSKNTALKDLYLSSNPLKFKAYIKVGSTKISNTIKMPEGSSKYYLSYNIENKKIASFNDNKLEGLNVGTTNAKVTLNGLNLTLSGTITVYDRLMGDINNDDEITIADVSMLYNHIKRKKIITDSETLSVADVNGDKKITVADVSKLYNYVKHKITDL